MKNRITATLLIDGDYWDATKREYFLTNTSKLLNWSQLFADKTHTVSIESVQVEGIGDPAELIAEEIVTTLFTQKGENVDKIKPIIERILKEGK